MKVVIEKENLIEEEINPKDQMKIVTFVIGEERYGLEIFQVKEVTTIGDYTKIPKAQDYILGLFDLRGEVVVLVDLEKKFGLQSKKGSHKKHIIVSGTEYGKIGVVVDEVERIITIDKKEIREPEQLIKDKVNPIFLSGVIIYDEKVLILLDLAKLLGKKELVEIQKKEVKE